MCQNRYVIVTALKNLPGMLRQQIDSSINRLLVVREKTMSDRLNCSQNLLRQIRIKNLCWYSYQCQIITSDRPTFYRLIPKGRTKQTN